MNNKLILTPFRMALRSLEEAVVEPKTVFVRDATIQRFEYTYDLAWKMMKRHIEMAAEVDLSGSSKRDLFREAAKRGLIDDPAAWFEYTESRNKTSHTYNERLAEEVYREAAQFAKDARNLLTRLEAHHA